MFAIFKLCNVNPLQHPISEFDHHVTQLGTKCVPRLCIGKPRAAAALVAGPPTTPATSVCEV